MVQILTRDRKPQGWRRTHCHYCDKKVPAWPLSKGPCPAAANSGARELTEIVPPMLSPPTLTGVIPANTLMAPTLDGIDVGKWRIHVVGTGGNQIHAIHQ